MKRTPLLILAVILLLIGIYSTVHAANQVPDNVKIFKIDTGHTCVLVGDNFECYCPCEVCNGNDVSVGAPIEKPKPEKESKCNRGRGNGSEGCDPGNSGGKPGNAGEKNESSFIPPFASPYR